MCLSKILSALLLSLPLACSSSNQDAPADDQPEYEQAAFQPVMRWDHRAEARQWTAAAMQVTLSGAGQPLTGVVPRDIVAWCPGYPNNGPQQRAAFWVGLLSAMAKHESTWNPAAVGGGGQWFGLVQISPATARGYGCGATSGAALQDGAANLSCAARIMAQTVLRDGVVAEGMRGVAADWGPFHNDAKRAEMAAWTSSQSYCR
ncbi:transglycosylase SLT domain-containing protein [Profundibacter sp.]